ncbi:MAG: hypothetical protein ABWX94_02275 [Candidatus Saccharimonadales bacterium]
MPENDTQINIEKLKDQLLRLLANYHVDPVIGQNKHSRGATYEIKTKEAQLVVTLGDEWIGYELEINPDTTEYNKHGMRAFEDTDLYPLGGKNLEISMEIFHETLTCLRALLDGEIFIGIDEKHKTILAIPINSTDSKVRRSGRFMSTYEILTKKEVSAMSGLRKVQ